MSPSAMPPTDAQGDHRVLHASGDGVGFAIGAGSKGRGRPRQRHFSATSSVAGLGSIESLLNPIAVHEALLHAYLRLCGLEPRLVDISPDTHIHCWVPSAPPAWHPSLWCGPRQGKTASRVQRQPVLLLHGFGASAMWQWMHQVRALGAAGFDVYMPDLIFFGGSWSGSHERSVEFQAESMALLMAALGVPSFHINGISYGGFVAYRLALAYPQRVRSLTLTNSGLMLTQEEKEGMLRRWGAQSTWDLLLPQDPSGVQRLINLAYHRPPRPPPWLLQKTIPVLFRSMVQEKKELLQHLDRLLEEGTEKFPKPEMDVLLLWGKHDGVFPVAVAERIQRAFGGEVELEVLDGASHMGNAEQPHEYNAAFTAFLQRSRGVEKGEAPGSDCLLRFLHLKAMW